MKEAQGAETQQVKRKPSAQGSFISILNSLNNLEVLELIDETESKQIRDIVKKSVEKWMLKKFQ